MKNIPRGPIQIDGMIQINWIIWFLELIQAVDEIRQPISIAHASSGSLTLADLGKIHVYTIGTSDVDVYLPSVGAPDLQKWIQIIRVGTGTLRIRAVDSDTIEYSSRPGIIWCNEPKRLAANLTLQLISETQWGIISGTGIWKTV